MPGYIFIFGEYPGEPPPHVCIFNETAKHEPFSLAPDAGSSIIKGQSSGREADGIPEEQQSVPPGDLLSAVMAPERLQTLQEINDQFWNLLTDEEKQKIDNGMSIFLIIPTLDQERQQKIVQWEQTFLSSLDEQQKNDLMFLGSGLLDGRDLETRQAILGRLKENDGAITYEDLVDIGVFEPGTLSENGFVWGCFKNASYAFSASSVPMLRQKCSP